MSSLIDTHLECSSRIKINFNGGNLSSDTGLFLLKNLHTKLVLKR